MLENVVDPILSLQAVKTQSEKFKIQKGTPLTYETYYELLILAVMYHDRKFKQDSKFSSKSQCNVYELGHIPNDGYDASFNIYSSIDMVQAYASQKLLSSLKMNKEQWYRISTKEILIWDKLSEASKATILGNTKTPHKTGSIPIRPLFLHAISFE